MTTSETISNRTINIVFEVVKAFITIRIKSESLPWLEAFKCFIQLRNDEIT